MAHSLKRKPGGRQAFSTDFHRLSHDLRTPLTQIHGFAELLLIEGNLDDTQVSYVEAILRGSKALQDIVLAHLNRAEARSEG